MTKHHSWPFLSQISVHDGALDVDVWRINVEMKRVDEVVIPVVAGHQTFTDRGLAQVAGWELGARMMAERSAQ